MAWISSARGSDETRGEVRLEVFSEFLSKDFNGFVFSCGNAFLPIGILTGA